MNTKVITEIEQGVATAFIDASINSNLAFKPQFVSNNYKEVSNWKDNSEEYQKIQGILIDVKTLMNINVRQERVCQVKCVNSFYTSFRNLVRYRVLTEIPVMVETCL